MKKPIKTFFVVLISCVSHFHPPSLLAQGPMIGLEFGYGRSQMTSHGHSFISPFDPDFYTRLNIGIQYSQPVSTWLSVSSGLEFIRRTGLDGRGLTIDDKFSHLAIPLRVDFTLGNTFQFLIGPGLNLNFLIAYDLGYYKNHPGFEESNNDIQVGWQFHAGVGVKISPKTRIHFLYVQGFDLTSIYDQSDLHPDYVQGERWYDGVLTAGVMTNVNTGKKK